MHYWEFGNVSHLVLKCVPRGVEIADRRKRGGPGWRYAARAFEVALAIIGSECGGTQITNMGHTAHCYLKVCQHARLKRQSHSYNQPFAVFSLQWRYSTEGAVPPLKYLSLWKIGLAGTYMSNVMLTLRWSTVHTYLCALNWKTID